MEIERTDIDGLVVIHPVAHRDERGLFAEAFNLTTLTKNSIHFIVDQVNVSMSIAAGTVRGMHWQEDPFGQVKLVRCIQGEALDVVVDIRPSSPTYGKYKSFWLKAADLTSILVPKGCAHGWQAIRDFSQIEYLVSGPWNKAAERGLCPTDPKIGIIWPKSVASLNPRDASWPPFNKSTVST